MHLPLYLQYQIHIDKLILDIEMILENERFIALEVQAIGSQTQVYVRSGSKLRTKRTLNPKLYWTCILMASSNFVVARMEWASKLAKAIEITREIDGVCLYSVVLFSCQIYSIYVPCCRTVYLNFESYIYSNKN